MDGRLKNQRRTKQNEIKEHQTNHTEYFNRWKRHPVAHSNADLETSLISGHQVKYNAKSENLPRIITKDGGVCVENENQPEKKIMLDIYLPKIDGT